MNYEGWETLGKGLGGDVREKVEGSLQSKSARKEREKLSKRQPEGTLGKRKELYQGLESLEKSNGAEKQKVKCLTLF